MSITRSTSELKIPAPPPSPIPTGRGSRSAANEILIEYLEKSLNVPDLALPEPCIPLNKHQNIPVEINYRLLESRDWESKDRPLKSVKEFGVFKVIDHGISVEELGFLVKEADRVFRVMEPKNVGFRRNYQQEEIVWVLSGEERMELAGEFVGAERFRDFSEKMENVASKLEAIARQLYNFLVENAGKEHFGKTMAMQGNESILSLFRYNHRNDIELEQQMVKEKNGKCSDHILRLHFPTTQSQFSLQTDQGPLCFDVGPDTIVVTVGKHLQERIRGGSETVCEEIICAPHLQDSQASFSIELQCLSSNLDMRPRKDYDTISLRDQILIGIIIAFLYNIYVLLWS